ncbi:MAG TPA: hypothetical protein VG474_03375 [Solirubrobacteraceae bacterium]|nr:hypothetical protein [Solirubrobacteraceae bacterium]
MNLRSLARTAKQIIDRRGGTKALKEDAQELREIVRGGGTAHDKAKAATEALRDPGGRGEHEPQRADEARPAQPAQAPAESRIGGEPPAGH